MAAATQLLTLVLLFCALTASWAMKEPLSRGDEFTRSKRATAGSGAKAQAQTPFTFDDIFDPLLRPRGFDGRWVSGNNDWFTFRDSIHRNLMLYNAADDTQTLLMANTTFTEVGTGTYYISPDLKYILLPYNIESLWRYSFSAQYKIYNVETRAITHFPAAPLNGTSLQFAGWSSSGHALSFVHGNNLYVQESPTSTSFTQLTTDGDARNIFNGVSDWLYEEDVLGEYQTHYWSPDSLSLCYATFNDTEVPTMSWPVYGNKDQIYPTTKEIGYAKPGDLRGDQVGPNPRVTLTCINDVFNYPTSPKVNISAPAVWQSADHYYTSLSWPDNSTVLVAWVNRVQNHIIVHLCESTTGTCTKNYERQVANGWVQAPWPTPIYINDGAQYITYLPKPEGNDFFNHIAYVDTSATNSITYLSSGLDEVVGVVGYDHTNHLVYYIATNKDPTERHLFRVGTADAASANQAVVCLTCEDACKYNLASFSSSATYFIHSCRGPTIYKYWLRDFGTKLVTLEDNADVEVRLAQKLMPTRVFSDINMDGGYVAKAVYHLPPGYTPGAKYPLLLYGYGGPDSQQVVKTFDAGSTRSNWLRYLGSSENVVVASLDGAGASLRGENFRFKMYRKLGTVEIWDHLEGGRHFKSQTYVDPNKNAAIFGWSYGGFTTSHALANDSNVFQCGLAVAPVTSYRYYDTAYTERYMGLATPVDNSAGYDATDVMNKVQHFAGKHFLLVHGTADDNVHFQHSVQLVNSLTAAEIQFKLMMYADENHGIPYSSRHLYRLMTDNLLNDCWPEAAVSVSGASLATISLPLASLLLPLLLALFQRAF